MIETLSEWLKENHHWECREYHYHKIKPQIIVEQLLDDGHQDGPLNYGFCCFGGNTEMIQVDNSFHSIDAFYDVEWDKLQVRHRDDAVGFDLPKPANLKEMLCVASNLSSDFDFVRVDLYNLNQQFKFGELTFTPRAGDIRFSPNVWDAVLGRK